MPRNGVFLPPPHTKSHTVGIDDRRMPMLFPGSPVMINRGWMRRVLLGEPTGAISPALLILVFAVGALILILAAVLAPQ